MVTTSRARIAAPAFVLALCVAGWDIATRAFSVSSGVLPSPGLVVQSTWDDRASLWPAIETTTREAVLGILVAIVVAFVLAVAIDWEPVVRRAVFPLMVFSQTLPIVALAPIVVVWFGFGESPKIGLVALFTFFAISVGLVQGLASADHDTMNLLRTLGASRAQLLVHARLPSSLPQFFTGLRIAVTFAYVMAIYSESFGAQQGLGVYMTTAKGAFRTDLVFGAVLVTAVLTLALYGVVALAERLAMPWRRPSETAVRW
jgi:ABC-type nitrate/sulfonate/bicarbonate transport system permease component